MVPVIHTARIIPEGQDHPQGTYRGQRVRPCCVILSPAPVICLNAPRFVFFHCMQVLQKLEKNTSLKEVM